MAYQTSRSQDMRLGGSRLGCLERPFKGAERPTFQSLASRRCRGFLSYISFDMRGDSSHISQMRDVGATVRWPGADRPADSLITTH